MACGAVAALSGAVGNDVIVVGFDGSPDAVDAIRAVALQATALQPAVTIALLAVDQPDGFIRTGSTVITEKQLVDCLLVTRDSADRFDAFKLLPEPASTSSTQ